MEIALFPSSVFRWLRTPSDLERHVNVLLSLAVLMAVFLSEDLLGRVMSLPHFCLMEQGLGLPCPGCGMVSAFAALARGEFVLSTTVQPCALALVGVVAAQSCTRLALLARLVSAPSADALIRVLDRAFLSGLILIWGLRLINATLEG